MGNVGKLLTIPALEQLPNVRFGFTTRENNLGSRIDGFKSPDDWNAVADAFGIPHNRLITVNQVHGDTIVVVDEKNYTAVRPTEADALVTNAAGIAIGIETADCVPVLLFDPEKRAIAAVHAGWRSTVQKIVRKTILKMQQQFGSNPASMIAGIGPAIGPECYEVDEPVMGPMREAFPFWKEIASERSPGKWGLDLVKANSLELQEIGLAQKNIHSLGMCTSCRRDLFYSFRAEGRTGRMLSVVMMT
jgi:YfiH family protein